MNNGGNLVVQSLEHFGVTRVFCVPGESYLPVLDALHDSDIATTVCRQEGGAAIMAEAWGKRHATPGICMVTRGPGATNASAGVHIAAQDSTPMILFVGQVATGSRYREAFQEVDYAQFFGSMAKWVAEIDSASRVQEMVSRAWHIATSGRPGPVVLVLPEDALTDTAEPIALKPWSQPDTAPTDQQMQRVAEHLKVASNPLAILGGSRWSAASVAKFQQIAERLDLPVACSFRRQSLFDHNHSHYAGDIGLGINPLLLQRIEEADLLLVIGARLSEITTQDYQLIDLPASKQTLIHVHAGTEEHGKLYQPDVAITASADSFCDALEQIELPAPKAWQGSAQQAHRHYLGWSSLSHTIDSGHTMRGVMEHLETALPTDAILCNGAGNYTVWIHRFWRYRGYGTQLAPTSGSMGYGLPAAIAAKLAHPNQTVVAFAGDGCFQMTSQELSTAVQANAAVIVLVIDNGMYGTIRMHQENHFPGRVSATDLSNPDFAALARACGAFGCTVNNADEFPAALSEAMAADGPSLIHIHVDPDALTPTLSLGSAASN
jgi:acetolactate synthase-1/2/3 large subunit